MAARAKQGNSRTLAVHVWAHPFVEEVSFRSVPSANELHKIQLESAGAGQVGTR